MIIIGDQLADFIADADFAGVYPREGAPAISPAILAMVTVLQYTENLSDRQAAAMVASRIDWKYALHLPLTYLRFDHTVLHDYRELLLRSDEGALVFWGLLKRLRALGLVRGRGIQRTDSFGVLGAVRTLTRLELVMEALRLALCAIERVDPAWLQANVPVEWGETYDRPAQAGRLVQESGEKGKAEVIRLAQQTGEHGLHLLRLLNAPGTPEDLQGLAAVELLCQVWEQQYVIGEESVTWAERPLVSGAELICTPHDPEARYSEKRGKGWVGYKVHITETVEEDQPRIITNVRTEPAPQPDVKAVAPIQEELQANDLEPDQHVVDSGYVSGKTLAESKERGVELVGPMAGDSSPQAHLPGGFTQDQFEVDREAKSARCPGGKTSVGWSEREDPQRGQRIIHISFSAKDCGGCPFYGQCVASKKEKPQGRHLGILEYHAQVKQRREEQQTEGFKQKYRRRAGAEATLSEMSRAHGMRHARHVGLAKVHLQNMMIATATNLKRAARWLAGEKRQSTRQRCLRSLAETA